MAEVDRSQNKKTETTEKKKAEDKGFFVQLPCYLIDGFQDSLTSTAFVAFLRFIRKYSKKGNAEYKGSYRALAKELNISHTSAIRITDQWQTAGIAAKQEDEESDMLTVFASLAPIWQKNIEYSKSLTNCPNLGKAPEEVEQNVTTQQLTNGSVVTNYSTPVTNCDDAVTICYNLVTFCSTFERKNDPRYIEITKILRDYIYAFDVENDQQDSDQTNNVAFANATSTQVFSLDLDPLSEDLPEAQPHPKIVSLPAHSYSHPPTPTNHNPNEPQQYEQNGLFGDPGYTNNQPEKDKKVKLTPEQVEQCKRWYAHFEKVRGEPFETKGDKINARTYIKKLVIKYDETTIMRIYKHLSEKDFKWSKPSFRFKITPYVVYTEAPSVLQQLNGSAAIPDTEKQSTQQSKTDTFAHVPAFGGKTEAQMEADFSNDLEFLRAAGIAI